MEILGICASDKKMTGGLDMEQIVQKLKSERAEEVLEALHNFVFVSNTLREMRILQELTLVENGRAYVKLTRQSFYCQPEKEETCEQERLGFSQRDSERLRGISIDAILHMARSKVVADFLTAHSGAKEMLHDLILDIFRGNIIATMGQNESSCVGLPAGAGRFPGLGFFCADQQRVQDLHHKSWRDHDLHQVDFHNRALGTGRSGRTSFRTQGDHSSVSVNGIQILRDPRLVD